MVFPSKDSRRAAADLADTGVPFRRERVRVGVFEVGVEALGGCREGELCGEEASELDNRFTPAEPGFFEGVDML